MVMPSVALSAPRTSMTEDRSLDVRAAQNRKVHETVAKIFAVIGVMALALTFYTAFGLVAAPVVVITAFTIASVATIACGIIVFLALYSRPSVKEVKPLSKPTETDSYELPVFEETNVDLEALPTPISLPPLSSSELLQMRWKDLSFTNEAFEHRAFFEHLDTSADPRDWTQKILEETSGWSISGLVKKWPELFSKGVLQKSDVLERLHLEVAEAVSFEQIVSGYPELFFEMGFLTRETPGLDLLVRSYICSHSIDPQIWPDDAILAGKC